jgi:hypothetical protein
MDCDGFVDVARLSRVDVVGVGGSDTPPVLRVSGSATDEFSCGERFDQAIGDIFAEERV